MTGSLTESQARQLLKRTTIGRVGCFDGGRVYIVPVNYLYDEGCIIGHSHAGKKISAMRKNPDVCFEVDQINSYKNWKSVIAWGTYEEINDPTEKWNVMKLLLKHKLYIKSGEKSPVPEIASMRLHPRTESHIIVYKIVLHKITGRYEIEDKEELL